MQRSHSGVGEWGGSIVGPKVSLVATAALIISILAIATSAWGVWYVRRQAVASEMQALAAQTQAAASETQAAASAAIAATDTQRNHMERTPRWEPKLAQSDTGGWWTLTLRLRTSGPLDSINVRIFETQGIAFTSNQKGIDPSDPSPVTRAKSDALLEGESATWRLSLEPERSTQLRLHVDSTSADESWSSAVHIDVPGDPSNSAH
jgi:hypothetical protein